MRASPTWAEAAHALYAPRWDWAEEAYEHFLAALGPQVQVGVAQQRAETNVALYGPSQVGKTTLLLTLLGVRAEHLEEVGKVLRHGRPVGMSATPTATRYRVASGDHWTWRETPEGKAGQVDSEEIQRRLARVRTRVESGSASAGDVIEVGIPRSWVADTGVEVSAVDLPGVDPTDGQERQHARDLVEQWVHASDLVLLVCTVSHLGPVTPGNLNCEALKHWPRQPERFRVVTMYSYSDSETTAWLGRDASRPSAEGLRADLHTELRDFAPEEMGALVPETLYPLEFGRSWQRLDATVRDRATALRGEFLNLLRRDLVAAAAPEARYVRALRAHGVAVGVLDEHTRRLDKEIEQLTGSAELARRAHKRGRDATLVLDSSLADLKKQAAVVDSCTPAPVLSMATGGSMPGAQPTWTGINGTVDQLADGARRAWKKWLGDNALDNVLHHLHVLGLRSDGLDEAERLPGNLRDQTSCYFGDAYRKLDEPFAWWRPKRRRAAVSAAISSGFEEAVKGLQKGHAEQAKRLRDSMTHCLEREIASVHTRRDHVARGVKKASEELQTAESGLRKMRDRRVAELGEMRRHVEVAATFPEFLARSYRKRQQGLRRRLVTATTPVEQLALVAALFDHAGLYDSIRSARPVRQKAEP